MRHVNENLTTVMKIITQCYKKKWITGVKLQSSCLIITNADFIGLVFSRLVTQLICEFKNMEEVISILKYSCCGVINAAILK